MRGLSLLSLPASLLLLISCLPAQTSSTEPQWPYNLPPHVKYFPEDEHLVRRNVAIQQKLAGRQPAGVRKMSDDEGEMFFMDYWQFEPELDAQSIEDQGSQVLKRSIPPLRTPGSHGTDEVDEQWTNASIPHQPLPPFSLHHDKQEKFNPHIGWFSLSPRDLFSNHAKRDFQCPTGTSACTSINRPDSCCTTGEICQIITNTGLGDVGCCGQGLTCSGAVSNCSPGNTPCPSAQGGGCCIPGFACVDVGCAVSSTAVVVIIPTTATPTSTSTSTPVPVVTTTVIVAPAAPSSISTSMSTSTSTPTTSTTTIIVPLTSSSTSTSTPPPPAPPSTSTTTVTITSTPTSTPSTCSPAYTTCPSSLGGGCCPTSMLCGPSTSCLPTTTITTTTIAAGAPVRPTSAATTTLTSQAAASVCPTGFYMCSAYDPGGCCRLGRDCSSTSCPTTSTTVVVNSDGITVVAPTGSALASASDAPTATVTATAGTLVASTTTVLAGAAQAASCAQGWFSCASTAGGGCCPSGYACGASCTAGVSGVANVGKVAASGAGRSGVGVGWVVGVVGVGVGWVWL